MENRDRIDPDMSIDEVMRRWPQTLSVIIDIHMLCIGCPLATFHTVVDAAREHEIDTAYLVRKLEKVIGK